MFQITPNSDYSTPGSGWAAPEQTCFTLIIKGENGKTRRSNSTAGPQTLNIRKETETVEFLQIVLHGANSQSSGHGQAAAEPAGTAWFTCNLSLDD